MASTNPRELLEELRWGVDSLVINAFDELVWLGPCFSEDGNRIGITECCDAMDPCEHHAEVARNPHAREGGK